MSVANAGNATSRIWRGETRCARRQQPPVCTRRFGCGILAGAGIPESQTAPTTPTSPGGCHTGETGRMWAGIATLGVREFDNYGLPQITLHQCQQCQNRVLDHLLVTGVEPASEFLDDMCISTEQAIDAP